MAPPGAGYQHTVDFQVHAAAGGLREHLDEYFVVPDLRAERVTRFDNAALHVRNAVVDPQLGAVPIAANADRPAPVLVLQ